MKDADGPYDYAVAQMGARMHYAVPRVLERAGRLHGLYTDIAGIPRAERLARLNLPPPVRSAMSRLAGRMPEGIPRSRVTSFPAFGLSYALRRRLARTPAGRAAVYLKAGSDFCRLVAGALDWERLRGIYAFNSAALELLEEARARGVHAVMEQTIAPRSVEETLLAGERERHPSLHGSPPAREQSRCPGSANAKRPSGRPPT